jgi:hypothetical protein
MQLTKTKLQQLIREELGASETLTKLRELAYAGAGFDDLSTRELMSIFENADHDSIEKEFILKTPTLNIAVEAYYLGWQHGYKDAWSDEHYIAFSKKRDEFAAMHPGLDLEPYYSGSYYEGHYQGRSDK